jgi:muramoyltetrapeptide carboxypeptidase
MRRAASALRLPPAVRPGDAVAVVAPGSPVEPSVLNRALRSLEALDLRPVPGRALRRRRGELAGSDEERAADLTWALQDPEVRAVWFARGGYGTLRLLPHLDLTALRQRPRLLLGFSDLTALFAPVVRYARIPAYYGPVLADLVRRNRVDRRCLNQVLARPQGPFRHRLPARATLVPGRARGPLVGGCLSLLQALVGTPFEPDYRGAILLLEEVGEAAYRIDRMLTHLRLAGRLDRVAGIVIGQMVGCGPAPRGGRPLGRVLREALQDLDIPVVRGLRVGHGSRSLTLPLGFTANLDTAAGLLQLEGPGGAGSGA